MKKVCLICALLILFLLPGAVFAQEKSWFFDKWDVAIRINKDSTFLVQEAQTFNFTGNYHWVTRTLVKNKGLRYADIKVYETDQSQLSGDQIEITETSSDIEIKLNFDLADTTHTWIFEYKVIGGIGFFDDYDELYWNVVSSDRAVEIKEAQATVYLPEKVDPAEIQQKIYLGYTGSTLEGYDFTAGTEELNFFADYIDAYDNFTIVAGWPKGVVENPGVIEVAALPPAEASNTNSAVISHHDVYIDGRKLDSQTPVRLVIGYDISEGKRQIGVKSFGYEDFSREISVVRGEDQAINYDLTEKGWHRLGRIISSIMLVLYFVSPIFVFIILYFRWKKFGKDPGKKKTIIAQYEPPDKITPAVMGVLIDEKADLQDITATIIDLAYRGYLKIYEGEGKTLLTRSKKYRFEKLKDFENDSGLKDYEKKLLDGIFGHRDSVKLEDLKDKFYLKIKEINDSLYEEATALGYFEKNPAKVRAKYILIGTILMVVGSFLLFVPIAWGLMILLFGLAMPKKTPKGAESRWWAMGFKLYLYTAERFRLGQVTPETFEKYLSYAMVFQVEKQWAERFQDIYKQSPGWYVSSGHFQTFALASFASNISSNFATSVSSGLSSHPSSSSGFGGGGFGGGGGGGGGSGAG
ncbi:MAG: DUF2207 domain-containing protein [Patescibacteria group bacterium]